MRKENEVKIALQASNDIVPTSAFQETTKMITVAVLEWVLELRNEIEI